MDRVGNVLAPMPVKPVNISEFELFPESFAIFRQVVREVGLPVQGSYFNYDSGVDSRAVRKLIWNAGMIPNIPENPRNRDQSKPKRGRPRCFNAKVYKERFAIERCFAWEDTYRTLVISYERKVKHQLGAKLLGYALINLRHFLGKSRKC
jgi:transposase